MTQNKQPDDVREAIEYCKKICETLALTPETHPEIKTILRTLTRQQDRAQDVEYYKRQLAKAALCVLENPHNAISDTIWLSEHSHGGTTLYEHLVGDLDIDFGGTQEEWIVQLREYIAATGRLNAQPEIDGFDETNQCACKFLNDECIDICCYHKDQEGKNKELRQVNEDLCIKLARLHNEHLALKNAATGGPNTPPEIEGLWEALEYRREDNERALERHKSFFGMNEDRPRADDTLIYEAAKRYAAQSRKCTCEETKIKCLCCVQIYMAASKD